MIFCNVRIFQNMQTEKVFHKIYCGKNNDFSKQIFFLYIYGFLYKKCIRPVLLAKGLQNLKRSWNLIWFGQNYWAYKTFQICS